MCISKMMINIYFLEKMSLLYTEEAVSKEEVADAYEMHYATISTVSTIHMKL